MGREDVDRGAGTASRASSRFKLCKRSFCFLAKRGEAPIVGSQMSAMELMEMEPCQTPQETISALQEKIARLQQQIEEQECRPNELNNANQVKCNVGLSWSFNKDDPVPDYIVSELYKQLNPNLRLTKERFSMMVNALPAMSKHVVVGSDPSVNSGLVEIINEEFENGSILYATTNPMANANGPHIDGFVMDSYPLSSNTRLITLLCLYPPKQKGY